MYAAGPDLPDGTGGGARVEGRLLRSEMEVTIFSETPDCDENCGARRNSNIAAWSRLVVLTQNDVGRLKRHLAKTTEL